MTRATSELAAQGFAVLRSWVTSGELKLLRHMLPTLAWQDSTIKCDAQPEELPPALLARCAILAAAALGQSRSGPAQLAFAQWYVKPPESPEALIDWHQDRAAWPNKRPPTVSIWVALDDADRSNGCLEFASGSHLPTELLVHRLRDSRHYSCRAAVAAMATLHADASPGDAVIYHERIAHRSGPNESPNWRRALLLGWNRTGL